MLHLKHSVRVRGIQPETVLAIIVAKDIFGDHGYPCTITSVTDGDHMRDSWHHSGLAVDLRIKHLANPDLATTIAEEIQEALGPDYDVVGHSDHLHIEYDPE
jgi:hypothetical protein